MWYPLPKSLVLAMKIEVWDKELNKFVRKNIEGDDFLYLLQQFQIAECECLIEERINDMKTSDVPLDLKKNAVFYKYD